MSVLLEHISQSRRSRSTLPYRARQTSAERRQLRLAPRIRRAKARKGQRGAALFVIMMAILLLSGLGMWAMHSASIIGRASGYSRAALQTQYIAEMGILAGTGYLSLPNMAALNHQAAQSAALGSSSDDCLSVSSGQYCRSISKQEIEAIPQMNASVTLTDTQSLSPADIPDPLQGDFTVEMTSPRPVIVPGSPLSADETPYRMVTLTSYGTVRPDPGGAASDNLCTDAGGDALTAENSSAGRIAMRAHAIIGPVK